MVDGVEVIRPTFTLHTIAEQETSQHRPPGRFFVVIHTGTYPQGVRGTLGVYSRVCRIVGASETIVESVVFIFIPRVLLLTFASVVTDFLRVLLLISVDSVCLRSSLRPKNSLGRPLVRVFAGVRVS